jgi:hypothetical protein
MRTQRTVALVLAAFLLVGLATVASAGPKSDFALFDGTNPANQGAGPGVTNPPPIGVAGAVCGVEKKEHAFTLHVTVTNHSSGANGFVRLTYADHDFVQYPMAPNDKFQISLIGGSKGGADRAIRISGVPAGPGGVKLVGQASILAEEGGKVFCKSCDATTEGGIGDAGCDAIVPD